MSNQVSFKRQTGSRGRQRNLVSSDTGRLKNRILGLSRIELKELLLCSSTEVSVIVLFRYIYFSGKIDQVQNNQGKTLEYQEVFG